MDGVHVFGESGGFSMNNTRLHRLHNLEKSSTAAKDFVRKIISTGPLGDATVFSLLSYRNKGMSELAAGLKVALHQPQEQQGLLGDDDGDVISNLHFYASGSDTGEADLEAAVAHAELTLGPGRVLDELILATADAPLETLWPAMERMVLAGRVRRIGVAGNLSRCMAALTTGRASLQVPPAIAYVVVDDRAADTAAALQQFGVDVRLTHETVPVAEIAHEVSPASSVHHHAVWGARLNIVSAQQLSLLRQEYAYQMCYHVGQH